jgi:hypothetical protein
MGATLLDFGTPPQISLESQMQRLSMEAEAVSNVIDIFRNLVPDLAAKIRHAYEGLVSEDDHGAAVADVKLALYEVERKLPQVKYTNYTKTLVDVPEGFDGDLVEFMEKLVHMAPAVSKEASAFLGEYNGVLAAFITNKDNKTALQDHTAFYKRVQTRREELTKELRSFFKEGKTVTKSYLGDVLHRFSDLHKLASATDKVNQVRKSQGLKDISNQVKKSVDQLDIVIENIRRNSVEAVSGPAALNISEGAYQVGKYVEFLVTYRYVAEQAIVSVQRLMKKLNEIL